MLILLTISAVMAVLYTGAVIWKRRSFPESISAMVFDLPKRWQWVWGIWLWSVAFTSCIPAITALEGKGAEAFGYLTLVCLVFTGAMPLYDADNKRMHYAFAIAAGILSQVCVGLISPIWLLAWLVYPMLPFIDGKFYMPGLPMWLIRTKTFIAEVLCAIPLYGALYVYYS